jgi:plasmid replication initiation protein
MSYKEQTKLFDSLNKLVNKFSDKEKEKFKMLLSCHKMDEELDSLSLNFLKELEIKYKDLEKVNDAKNKLDNLFKK